MKPVFPLPLLQAALFMAAPAPGAAVQQDAEPQARPNLLILLADDLGYADLGCQGSPDVLTPHIDSIAANGVRCTSGYVTGCVCSPTRGALLTARYQQRYGLDAVSHLTKIKGLRGDEQTLVELLKPAGYVSAMFGKWHLGDKPEMLPEAQGFDEFCYAEPLSNSGSMLSIRRSADGGILSEDPGENITTVIGREVSAFIERNQARPWLAYVGFKAPHIPHEPPPGYEEKFAHVEDKQRRLLCASMAAQDDTVGSILDALRKSGQEARTLVVYLSDNGSPNPFRGSDHSYNHPLRGAKSTLREGGIRVPFLLQWKGTIPAGLTYDRPITQMDIGATLLAVAGVKDGLPNLDGVNVLPNLTGQDLSDPHAALFWTYPGGQAAVRAGDWKLVHPRRGVAPQLFNLANDIGEKSDLAAQNPDKVKELQERLDAWFLEMGHSD